MQRAMQQVQTVNSPEIELYIDENNLVDISNNEWVKSLPVAIKDEFIMYLEYQKEKFIVCAEELAWNIVQDIDVECYKMGSMSNNVYYAEEHRIRKILSNAIKWIADVNSEEIIYNTDNQILFQIKHEYINVIWGKYNSMVSITVKEVVALESSALAYFQRNIDTKPVPSIIIEVDMLIHFGNLSWDEIRNIKYSKMERIKLVLKARAKALIENTGETIKPKSKPNSLMEEVRNLPPGMFPPGVREEIQKK
jgi:hypothetical protein